MRQFRRVMLLGSVAAAAMAATAAQAQDAQLDSTSISFRYDGAGRQVAVINPDPDGDGPLHFAATRTYYDPAGLVVRVETGELATWQPNSVSPSSWTGFTILKTERFYYDTQNLLVKTEVVGSDGVVAAVSQKNYDRAGREGCVTVRMNPAAFGTTPASACDQGAAGGDGKDRITRKFYDAAGQMVQERRAVGTALEQAYVTYSYTTNGKQEYVIDADGNRAKFEYDGFDRLTRWYFPSATPPSGFNAATQATALSSAGAFNSADYEEYGYDANSNRERLRKRDGSVLTYQYDNLNRNTVKLVPERAGLDPLDSRDVYYSYDLRGLMTSVRFDSASGEGVTTTYDGFGRAINVTQMQLNSDGTTAQLWFQYDANGNKTRLTYPDGNFVTYKYDKLDRPDCILRSVDAACTAAAPTSILADYAYNERGLSKEFNGAILSSMGYDSVGRVTSLTNNLAAAAWNNSWTFDYNPSAQIKSIVRSNDLFAWTSHVNVDRAYATNGLNQYVTAGPAAFCYDANGNLTADGSSVYRYDIENRLVEKRAQGSNNTNCAALSYAGGLLASLRYDPLGRLIKVTSGTGAQSRFLQDSDALVAEYDGGNNLLRRYVHGGDAKRDDPIVWYEGSGFAQANERHLRTDWQGSVVLVADATGGNVIAANSYDEYGVPKCPLVSGVPDCTQPGANQGRFQYTGQAWIGELGMYYYKARIYSPTLGRFLQTDPIGYSDKINLYAYVGNDPLNRIDPSGEVDRSYIPIVNAKTWRGSLDNATIAAADSTFNPTDVYTVSAHGSPTGFGSGQLDTQGKFDPQKFVADLRAHGWDGKKPILILACNVGQGDLPGQIAAIAKVPVIAPTGYVVPGVGKQTVVKGEKAPEGGRFVQFNPNGTRQNPFGVNGNFSVVGVKQSQPQDTFGGMFGSQTTPIVVVPILIPN